MAEEKLLALPKHRLKFLDGLRGIAILSVVFVHTYSRWPNLVPYGDRFLNFPLFKYGSMGVMLFFMISGFVIFMTLEKCASFWQFMKKRWLRLFPSMLIATILIYSTAHFFFERPMGMPHLRDVLPGLSFIDPFFWGKILGGSQSFLEGGFWTLFVEFAFYIIFGYSYFKLKDKSVWVLAALAVAGYMTKIGNLYFTLGKIIYFYTNLIGLEWYCWFWAGALGYIFYKNRSNKNLLWFLGACLFSIGTLMEQHSIDNSLAGTVVVLLFVLPMLYPRIEKILSNKFLLFMGFVSYPLYLIHENALISLIIKLGKIQHFIPMLLLPVLPIAFLILVAFIMARFLEPFVRSLLLRLGGFLAGRN